MLRRITIGSNRQRVAGTPCAVSLRGPFSACTRRAGSLRARPFRAEPSGHARGSSERYPDIRSNPILRSEEIGNKNSEIGLSGLRPASDDWLV
jgi:hypothetical protein